MFCCSGGGSGIVDRALVVRANSEECAYALAVDHDCGSGGGAGGYRFGVGVLVGGVDFAEVSTLHGFGPLLARLAPSILDLHQLGTGGNLTVKVGVYLVVKAWGVKALCGIRATGKYFRWLATAKIIA